MPIVATPKPNSGVSSRNVTPKADLPSRSSSVSPSSVPSSVSSVSSSPSPNKENKANSTTVILFDWDDTLCPSSFLSGKGYRLDSEHVAKEVEQELKELEVSITGVLNAACQYGEVYIVTNAETGWVQLSAQKFLPGVVPLLSKVTVVSARSTFEQMFPDAPLKWKFYAFQEKLMPSFNNNKVTKNIISFGDSHVEREAIRAVTRGFPNTKTKSIKFAERPSMEQLRRQIDLVINCFAYIHNHEGDLDLQLSISVNGAQAL